MEVKKLPFKLLVDDILVTEYYIDGKFNFLFLNNNFISIKCVENTKILKFICDSCSKTFILKSLQLRIRLNKPYTCISCRNKGPFNVMYNKHHTQSTKANMSLNRQGEKNPFYGKTHSNESKIKQRDIKIGKYLGENNPMYGKTYFDVWVENYGVDIAIKKLAEKSKKNSYSVSGNKNPMYGKSIIDIWTEKYGEEIANEKHSQWINNIKAALLLKYRDNEELKEKISLSLKGRIFSNDHKLKLRLSSIEYVKRKLELNGNKLVPYFNIYACQLLDEISALKKINIQHALNGGEFFISELGYWVDGYDQKNNVVYEYYEKEHKTKKQRDRIRQNEIQKYLKCDFIIIHEGDEIKYLKQIEDEI